MITIIILVTIYYFQFSHSVMSDFATPWTSAYQASLSITSSRSLLKLMSIASVMLSNHHILCHPLLLPLSIFPSIRVFSNESALLIMWPKYWGFSFNISPSNEHPGLISFRIDWLDPLAVQETLKSLFQHHSSKASILWCSAFFIVQHSHPCITTGKNIGLTRWKIMSAFLEHNISYWASTCGSDFNCDTFYSLEGSTVYWEDSPHPGVELPILKSWLYAITKPVSLSVKRE